MNKKKMEEKKKEYDFEERMKELREEVTIHNKLSINVIVVAKND